MPNHEITESSSANSDLKLGAGLGERHLRHVRERADRADALRQREPRAPLLHRDHRAAHLRPRDDVSVRQQLLLDHRRLQADRREALERPVTHHARARFLARPKLLLELLDVVIGDVADVGEARGGPG